MAANTRKKVNNWHCPLASLFTCTKIQKWERSPSRAKWGKASPSQPLLTETQKPSNWPHPGLSKVKLTHPQPGWQGTSTDYCKDQAVFEEGAVRFPRRVVKYWNRLPAPLFMSSSVSAFKKTVGPSRVRNRSCSTCVISVPFHQHFCHIVTPNNLCFPYPQILFSLHGHC